MKRSSKAVVLGAGLGGLAAAARLQAKGYQTTIIERNAELGGRAHTFNRDGRIYDAGPTVVTAPYLFAELFSLFGESMEDHVTLLPVDPWYRYEFPDGDHFDYSTGEALYAEIERVAPGELPNYMRFRKMSAALFSRGYEELGDAAFLRLSDMFRQLPYLLKTRSFLSLYGLTKRFFKSEKLRQVFSTPSLLVGGSPLETPAIYGLIHALEQKWGVWFAKGGTGALVAALEALLVRHGVDIQRNQTVSRVETDNGKVARVVLENGRLVEGDLFVSNLDPSWLYEKMLPSSLPASLQNRLSARRFSFGLFVQFFAVKHNYPDVAHHTILLQENYTDALKQLTRRGELAQTPNIYLHRPVATQHDIHTDPSEELYYALAPVPNLKIAKQKNWDEIGSSFEARVLQTLEQRMLPELSQHLTQSFYTDPIHFKERFCSMHGAGFSISPNLTQSAWFRFRNRSHLANLYLVGAGTHPGAGMPGVINSARVLEHLIPAA
ncbi:MAG: phytoene desaturase family protein [Verrucomicrobiota bacterium]